MSATVSVTATARLLVVGLLAMAIVTLARPTQASASCFFDENAPPLAVQLADQPLVFVGVAVEAPEGGKVGLFEVDEVWYGDLGAKIEVRGAARGDSATSIDRYFEAEQKYLVVPQLAGDGYIDNSCSLTRIFDEEADQARPVDARQPDETFTAADSDGESANTSTLLIIVGTVLAGAAALGGVAMFAKRSTPGDVLDT